MRLLDAGEGLPAIRAAMHLRSLPPANRFLRHAPSGRPASSPHAARGRHPRQSALLCGSNPPQQLRSVLAVSYDMLAGNKSKPAGPGLGEEVLRVEFISFPIYFVRKQGVLGEGVSAKLEIQIKLDTENKILSIRVRGVGMTKEDLIKKLETIVKSVTSGCPVLGPVVGR